MLAAAVGVAGCGAPASEREGRPADTAVSAEAAAPPPRTDLPGRSVSRAVCTARRPCWYVQRLGDASSRDRVASHLTRQVFSTRRGTAVMAWADGNQIPAAPIGSTACGVHFVLAGRVVGWTDLCGDGRRPMRLHFTNVSQRRIKLVVGYYSAQPVRQPARPRRGGASRGRRAGGLAI
jgi:hypothetical protein